MLRVPKSIEDYNLDAFRGERRLKRKFQLFAKVTGNTTRSAASSTRTTLLSP